MFVYLKELYEKLPNGKVKLMEEQIFTDSNKVLNYLGMDFDFSRENIFVFGAESAMFWKSMALAIMYGLGVTTILTLFLLPTLYSLVEGGKEKIKLFFYSKK